MKQINNLQAYSDGYRLQISGSIVTHIDPKIPGSLVTDVDPGFPGLLEQI